jgi:hypothetical protein
MLRIRSKDIVWLLSITRGARSLCDGAGPGGTAGLGGAEA